MKINHAGQTWSLHRATERRLIFHPVPPARSALADWRARRGLTQREAAERLGISQTQVAKIEGGSRHLPAAVAARMKSSLTDCEN